MPQQQQQQQRPKRQDSYLQAISGDYRAISPPNNRRAGAPRQASYQKATGNLSPDSSVLDFNQVVNRTKQKQTRQSSYQKAIGTMSPDDRYV